MARKRSTIDVWDIQANYGQGWESECEEFSQIAAIEQLRSYRLNTPQYPVRAVKRRHKLANYTPEQLADINDQIAAAKQRWIQRRSAQRQAHPTPALSPTDTGG